MSAAWPASLVHPSSSSSILLPSVPEARHASHVTRHTSHVTRHTSHVTRHTSHVTRHASHGTSNGCQEATSCSQRGARDRLPVQHTRRRWARRLGRAAAKLPVATQSPESTVRGRGATATRSDGGQTDPIRKNPTGIDDGHSALTVQQTLRRRCCCCCCCCCCC
jgi:hypothetical protein